MRPTSSILVFLACCALGAGSAGASPSTPEPASTGSPAPTSALREIGHVRAQTQFCQDAFSYASFSTAMALQNDATLMDGFHQVATTELDEDAFGKPKLISSIVQHYETMLARAKGAIEATKALRKLADDAPTPDQKAALIAYADALGGALHRQELLGKEYLNYSVYLQAHDPVSWQDHDRDLVAASISYPMLGEMATDPRDRVPQTLDEGAKLESERLIDVHNRVLADEEHASANVDPAFAPCQPDEPEPASSP